MWLCIARLRITWHGAALQGASGQPLRRWRGWEELMKLVAEKSCDEHALPLGGRSYISLTLGGTFFSQRCFNETIKGGD